MQAEKRSTGAEAAKTAVDRLMFFSDAVVAIAMTLLAIDLPVPDSTSREALFAFVGHALPEYLAFLVSFVVIARFWRGHHRLFRYVTDTTDRLVTANTLWLLAVILTPFATKALFSGGDTTDSDFPFRFTFYAAVQAGSSLSVYACARVVAAHGLLSEHAPRSLLPRSYAVGRAVAGVFIVSIPLAFVIGQWAFLVWGLIGVTTNLAVRRAQRLLEPDPA